MAGVSYADKPNGVVGPTSAGKTWLAMLATMSALELGIAVYYADMEDVLPEFKQRIVELGWNRNSSTGSATANWPTRIPACCQWPTSTRPWTTWQGFGFVIFDVMNRLLARVGGEVNSGNTEILWLYDNLFSPLSARGTGSLILDHPNKAGSGHPKNRVDPLAGAGGGGQKLNAMTGHSVSMKVIKPFSKMDPEGVIDLYTLKDRSGHFTQGDGGSKEGHAQAPGCGRFDCGR